ncbi:protein DETOXIFICATION 16-like [Solanum tuberosum]|uniref:protein DETOXIFICATION 16-like n=1 Tax=Solanum tuberosum TaxID=4113 RepID=UPI00073A4064|nr:PREDICTED: protein DETOXIFICATION 16-like [Solanum tuberosum]
MDTQPRKNLEVFAEVKKLLALAMPLMLVHLLLFFLQVISVMFVGHRGELALSGASLATSFAFVTGFSLLLGMGSALETLCGQAYGATQHHMLGIYMQRRILVILRQDPEIAAEAGIYARFMIPSIFAYGLIECQIKFLQTQNIIKPMMLTTGITLLLHVLSCWILVLKTDLGSSGAALANALSYWINMFLLAAYIRISPSCESTWTGFSREALSDIPRYLRLAIPSALMSCSEIWSFEMLVLSSGLLPNPKLETSVLSISLNTSAVFHTLSEGLGGATSVRVSNELGAGEPQSARVAARAATLLATGEGTLIAVFMILVRKVWGHCYSNEATVVRYVAEMLFFIAGSHFIDAHKCVVTGIASGCGLQKKGAFVNLGAYCLLGLPTGMVLAFVYHIGGKGLWLGIIVALSAQTLIYLVVVLRTNWDKLAMKAAERISS